MTFRIVRSYNDADGYHYRIEFRGVVHLVWTIMAVLRAVERLKQAGYQLVEE